MPSNDERAPQDESADDDMGAGEWQLSLALVRLACLALETTQRELEASGCHKRTETNARERGAHRIFVACKQTFEHVSGLPELLDCTRDSAMLFKLLATSLSEKEAQAYVTRLSDDPLRDRVLVAEQAILMNALFIHQRAEELRRDVVAFTQSPPGSDLDPLGEAVMHSLHELRVSALASNHMVAEFNAALTAWHTGKHIGALALGCVSTPRGVN